MTVNNDQKEFSEQRLEHVVSPNDEPVKDILPQVEKVDKFGAHTKTDPREIALVKKLDMYMLV